MPKFRTQSDHMVHAYQSNNRTFNKFKAQYWFPSAKKQIGMKTICNECSKILSISFTNTILSNHTIMSESSTINPSLEKVKNNVSERGHTHLR